MERRLESKWLEARGRRPSAATLALISELLRWAKLCGVEEPDGILRSVPQFVRGPGRRLGWESTGTCKGDQAAFGNRIKRGIDYLVMLGELEGRKTVREADYQGVGILVLPGPCSSTGRAADS